MGQMTFALLYGIEQPEDLDFWGEDGDDGIVGMFAEMNGEEWVPKCPEESTLSLLGFYVAVGASGEDGIPDLEGFALNDATGKYGEEIKAALKRWTRFSEWCAKEGHRLPAAQLYLTETEVA